jgi:hypothetical protein
MTSSARANEREVASSPPSKELLEIDRLLHLVLTMDDLPKQLVLSKDQVKQIDSKLRSEDVTLVFHDNRPKGLKSIVENQWALPEWLAEILLEHQQDWLRQFEFQVSTLPYADSFGLLNPVVSKGLRLSNDTQSTISILTKEYRRKFEAMSQKNKSVTDNAIFEMRKKMMAILTPEQRHQYRLWFGKDLIDL